MGMLPGKVAIVTGAGQGVGKGTAHVLAREGAKVVIADLNGERAKATAELIQSKGGEALAYVVDVMNAAQVKSMVEAALESFRGLHILVNNAVAPSVNAPFAQSKEQDWDQDLGVGLKGYLICTRAVINLFLEQNYGRIISVSSSAGKMGSPNLAAYSAAKGAIIAFTKALARELAKTGVTVNSVAPGAVNTPMQDRLSDEFKAHMRSTIPMGRYAEPEEIGEMVAFLASDRANYITGQVYSVDGGRTMQ
jgi:NAD(P)-dependent dehydrogenase (short-subunit alcohol dehydrogenase family)